MQQQKSEKNFKNDQISHCTKKQFINTTMLNVEGFEINYIKYK